MKSSMRPKMRPARLEKMMPGDELLLSETTVEATRPKARPERVMPGDEIPSNRVMTEDKYAGGGMVRGCKGDQVSGKGFKGTY